MRDTEIIDQYYPTKVYDVAYPDSNLCIAACGDGYYWISRDKCQTWERKLIGRFLNLQYVHFIDKDNGVMQNGLELFITNDGAKTWDTVNCNKVFSGGCNNAKVVSPGIIYTIVVRGDGYFLGRTYDNGATWDRTDVINYKRFSNIIFLDKDVGFGIGGSGVPNTNYYNELVEKTTDAGVTWVKKLDTVIPKQNGRLLKGSFYRRKYGIVINYWGHTWKTQDMGETWYYDTTYPILKWASMGDVHWLSESTILGANDAIPQIIMYTEEVTEVEEVNNEDNDDEINIFPNPASDYIEICIPPLERGSGVVAEVVRVFDVLGIEHPATSWHPSKEGNVRIDVSSLSPGVYFVKVGGRVSKFLKM